MLYVLYYALRPQRDFDLPLAVDVVGGGGVMGSVCRHIPGILRQQTPRSNRNSMGAPLRSGPGRFACRGRLSLGSDC